MMNEAEWYRLEAVATEGDSPSSEDNRKKIARAFFDGACETRAASWSSEITFVDEFSSPNCEHLPLRETTARTTERDFPIPPICWGEQGLGQLDGDWWTTGNAELRIGLSRVVIYGIEIEPLAAKRFGFLPGHAIAPTQPRRGRKPGTGYDAADAPYLEKMGKLLKADKALTVHSAAQQVAAKAPGSATPESKADRLARKYRASQGIGKKGNAN